MTETHDLGRAAPIWYPTPDYIRGSHVESVMRAMGIKLDPAHPDVPVFTRTLEIGPTATELVMRVAPEHVAVRLVGDPRARLLRRDGSTLLSIPRSATSRLVKVLMSSGGPQALETYAAASPPARPLEPLTHGGPRAWPELLRTRAVLGRDDGPFAIDVMTLPDTNPWLCQMRPSGFDFLPGGRRAAVCTWDGDVWLVDGSDDN